MRYNLNCLQSQELELPAVEEPVSPISAGVVSAMSNKITSPTSSEAPVEVAVPQQTGHIESLKHKITQPATVPAQVHIQPQVQRKPRTDTDHTWDSLER